MPLLIRQHTCVQTQIKVGSWYSASHEPKAMVWKLRKEERKARSVQERVKEYMPRVLIPANTDEEVRGDANKATGLRCINDYPEITLLQKHRQDMSRRKG